MALNLGTFMAPFQTPVGQDLMAAYERDLGVTDTVDDAVALIERFEKQPGEFNSGPLIHHEWARQEATLKSSRLFANHVKPPLSGQHRSVAPAQQLRGLLLERARDAPVRGRKVAAAHATLVMRPHLPAGPNRTALVSSRGQSSSCSPVKEGEVE
jgi:hypothetical protein